MVPENRLRTAVWYGDQPFSLYFPAEWDVTILWPRTPPPLTDDQIAEILERPTAQSPIRQMCRGKSRPLVIIDDLTRPTPVARIMPFLLRHFQDAGVSARNVRILVATGTHGAPGMEAMARKVGPEAASACPILVHDPTRDLVKIGTTSFGTPVIVNKESVGADFVVGIGGIYPNHTAGFGGGSKLALGILGFRSIMDLHYRHQSVGWGFYGIQNEFRKDLDEIARMIRLNTMISLHVDAERQLVRVICGHHLSYYKDEVAFSRQAFTAPMPTEADVVISNAYPSDISLTFTRKKGITPLRHCPPGVSRIVIASCSEGAGYHGLFPFVNRPRFHRSRQIARRISILKPREITRKIALRFYRALQAAPTENVILQMAGRAKSIPQNPIWLYRPGNHSESLPSQIPGMRLSYSWTEILQAVRKEQAGRKYLKVLLYPCAPLQSLERPEVLGAEAALP